MKNWHAYMMVLLMIALTIYGQFVIKWQVASAGEFPHSWGDRLVFILRILLNPWVISAFLAAFLASAAWIVAMTRLDISRAYPLTAITFICVVIGGAIIFKEPVTPFKIAGVVLLVLGIVVGSQG